MTIRVAHLTSVHPADDVRIFVKECRSLVVAGYEVFLVAQGLEPKVVGGVRVLNVAKPRNRMERATRTAWSVLRLSRRLRADIYHFHDPELIPVGILLKLLGHRVIYDVHEDLPRQIRDKPWIHPLLRAPIARLASMGESLAGRAFDAIVAVTPTIAARFPSSSTVLVRNFPILEELAPASHADPYPTRSDTLAYVGGIAAARGAHQLVGAMNLVSKRHSPRLVMAGRFQPPALADELAAIPGWDHVDAAGWLGRAEIAGLLGSARIGLVTFLPTPNNRDGYPTKLFEYMAAGLPVVASDFPGWREFVDGADCGLLVDPQDPASIAAAIDRLLDEPVEAEAMGVRGQRAIVEQYSWEAESGHLLDLYARLVGRPAARARGGPAAPG
jgi:glycosyltransferase involved in cell wall biosynthesis